MLSSDLFLCQDRQEGLKEEGKDEVWKDLVKFGILTSRQPHRAYDERKEGRVDGEKDREKQKEPFVMIVGTIVFRPVFNASN